MAMTITQNLPITGRRGWTGEEIDRLTELGFFANEKIELIEGEIIPKMTQNEPHSVSICLAQNKLISVFSIGLLIRVQLPLRLGERSRPEPDLAVVSGSPRDYLSAHPSTAVLVIEVSDTTLIQDRETKAALYAQHGIAEYWIVNLIDRVVEIHRDPAPMEGALLGHGYREVQKLSPGRAFSPLAAPEVTIAVDELLP
jgi:Uma2 family endonuclease